MNGLELELKLKAPIVMSLLTTFSALLFYTNRINERYSPGRRVFPPWLSSAVPISVTVLRAFSSLFHKLPQEHRSPSSSPPRIQQFVDVLFPSFSTNFPAFLPTPEFWL